MYQNIIFPLSSIIPLFECIVVAPDMDVLALLAPWLHSSRFMSPQIGSPCDYVLHVIQASFFFFFFLIETPHQSLYIGMCQGLILHWTTAAGHQILQIRESALVISVACDFLKSIVSFQAEFKLLSIMWSLML